jgi:hypothetical protein
MVQPFSRRQWAFLVIGVIIIGALAPHVVHTVLATRREYPWDGKVDWFAARAWWSGVNPYSAAQLRIIKLDGLGHPPTTPFWFLPLASLDMFKMNFALALFVTTLLLGHFTLISVALDVPRRWPLRAVAIVLGSSIVLATQWMNYHLGLAQLSEIIAFLIVLGWFLLRRDEDVAGGIVLGLACTLKFFPGVMVACLLFGRRFRAVAAALMAWLAVNVVMLSRYGFEAWPQFFRGNRILTEYWIGNLRNGSIFGIVLRAFVPSCRGPSGSRPAATMTAMAISVVILLGTFWLTRRRWRDARLLDLPYALMALAAYFCNPWIWEHYNVLLILPMSIAAFAVWQGRISPLDAPLSRNVRLLGVIILASVSALLLFLPLGYCAALMGQIRHRPSVHVAMHVAEVANWISPVLLMTLFVAMLWPSRASAPRA